MDIAREAGVSITTVSHALNGKGRLTAETRERILQVADRVGYRANVQARGLARGRSMTLVMEVISPNAGVLVPDFAYFVELLNAASAAALGRGYALVLAPSGANAESVRHLAADGAIVVDPTGDEPFLSQSEVPVVTTGRVPGSTRDRAWVDNDHRAGARRVLEHLAETGRTRPALLTTAAAQSYVEDTVAEYLAWCEEQRIEPVVGRVTESPTETAVVPVARNLLSRRPRPDAIYTTLDRMAVGVLLVCRSERISVPGDLAIAAVTDSALLRSTSPSITALNLDAAEIGRRATELLVSLVEGETVPTTRVVVPSTLVARASTTDAAPLETH